ncbi:MAG TPA: DNA polymerase III subunit gamma/tau [Gemmatimonadales bacterium]|nr:DNA polymerase III subunit gamma/tau [Gemmatimonadales bacterium]
MIALARKYRPKRFADLLVQDHVATALRGAVARGRVGHGYLLTGPRGTGKTTAARILAMALNCERADPTAPTGEPCGACASCQRVWSGATNLDVVEIDAASNRGVDDARDLRERAMYAASQEGRHKVYIVDEAHMLTREAWNALLKILEEPPPGVVFVFATTEPQKIASTAAPVLSRLQRFDFRRIGPAAIRDRLRQVLAEEKLSADDDALALIARYADGGMRDALSVLDQCLSFGEGPITAAAVREVLGLIGDEQYAEVLRLVVERDSGGVFPLVDGLVNAGADLAEFMTGTAELLRALLMVQSGAVPEGLTEILRQAIERSRNALQASDAVRMLALLAEAETSIRRSASVRLVVETLLLRWTLMDRVVDLEQVIAGAPSAPPSTRPEPPPSRPSADRTTRDAAPASAPRAGPARETTSPAPPAAPGAPPGELTLDSLLAAWPVIVEAARSRSILLGQALEATPPGSVARGEIRLVANPDHAVLVEGIQRQAGVVVELVEAHFGVRARVLVAPAAVAGNEPAERPKRITDQALRTEKLERLRRLDPALDTAANELDLEIVDEA